MQDKIKAWANKYVPLFNEISNSYFYTQSPLDVIEQPINDMIIGINPKGADTYVGYISSEEYLSGNSSWGERFDEKGLMKKDWGKFLNGVHTFLGYDNKQHPESVDNDCQTVWTNIVPFNSPKGSTDLSNDKIAIGIKSTMELITILEPKRIILLGVDTFNWIEKHTNKQIYNIETTKPFKDINLTIGRINNIPTYCVAHPSGKWPISHNFTTNFLRFLKDNDIVENGKPNLSLEELKNTIVSKFEIK